MAMMLIKGKDIEILKDALMYYMCDSGEQNLTEEQRIYDVLVEVNANYKEDL